MNNQPPLHAEAHVVHGAHRTCSNCAGILPNNDDQWRCPWVGCQAWFRGTADQTEQQAAT